MEGRPGNHPRRFGLSARTASAMRPPDVPERGVAPEDRRGRAFAVLRRRHRPGRRGGARAQSFADPGPPAARPYLESGPYPPPDEHPIFVKPWHPEPPPVATASSACNFDLVTDVPASAFSPDFHAVQILAGGYWSARLGPSIPNFDYAPLTVRYLRTLTAPQETTRWWRGYWDQVFEFTAAPITSSYGSYLAGPTGILKARYSFVRDNFPVVPYVQAGAGFVLNDAYKDMTQRAIGEAFEFNLQVQAGLRFYVCERWSIDVEGGFQHTSNARLASRNYGANAFGVLAGLTYHFPTRWR